jgi:ABC-type uncharacterized transport system fused permease/ATPase subunit
MQTASAFSSVQTALSFFVNAYRQLAEWRAVIARLDGFNIAVESAQAAATATPGIEVAPHAGKDAIRIEDLVVRLPQGGALVAADDIVISAGERVLVTGASGAGKSTLFRAIAGHLAVRRRDDPYPQRRQGDDCAAAALLFDRHARRRDHPTRRSRERSAPKRWPR